MIFSMREDFHKCFFEYRSISPHIIPLCSSSDFVCIFYADNMALLLQFFAHFIHQFLAKALDNLLYGRFYNCP